MDVEHQDIEHDGGLNEGNMRVSLDAARK